MQSRWSETKAAEFLEKYAKRWGEDLALRTYSARLLGAESSLVLHGGGNTSVKTTFTNLLGQKLAAIYVKASGHDLATIEPEGHSGLDLDSLRQLRALQNLSDPQMVNALGTRLLDSGAATPSIETLVHAFLRGKFIDHTHADAILAITNQPDGAERAREALGRDVTVLDYVEPGFTLAQAAAAAFDSNPSLKGMVWARHGLVTWGETARESYERTVEMITRAENYLARNMRRPVKVQVSTPLESAKARWTTVAPIVRGLLAQPTGDPDHPFARVILRPLIQREVLDFVDSDRGRKLALTPPLTADHLIRTKALPLWVASPQFDDPEKLRAQCNEALQEYARQYDAYFARHSARLPEGVSRFDSLPRVMLMPGLGALCAGKDARTAGIARDITAHTLAVKAQIAAMGEYQGLDEAQLFYMEYRTLQHAKLGGAAEPPLAGQVALVTGAAGAIGSAIVEELLDQGCQVAATDLTGEPLNTLVQHFQQRFGERVIGVPLDVGDPASVSRGFETIIGEWGGVDLLIINAGVAHVASLAELDLEAFRRLERVNEEGTLLLLAEAARHFKRQATGGDIVLISTKNVFAPGAKFGAYSATKAAAHQLARIASLEMAELGVRVNMVAPDAVFAHGPRKSGLWEQIGPERMRSRGMNEHELEEYYRNRNLLKARITAKHVAQAVLFFATRQTPTTGATLPVDGGLPDAAPR